MESLTPTQIAVGVIALLLVIGIIVSMVRARGRSALRSKFGPEYDRTVGATGSTRKAEAVLHRREARVSAFEFRPLTIIQREQFSEAWRTVQARFVDDPGGALAHADVLVADVMVARGYPIADFDRRAADLSVDHPDVVQNYRAGHDIAGLHANGEATTEQLRQAMIHYRALFDELVNEPGATLGQTVVRPLPGEKVRR